MDRIQFGTFIWPINPETLQLEYLKEPRYVTSNGNTVYAGLSPLKRTVTGSGYFTGANAYLTMNELAKLCDGTPRTFSHTRFGEMNGFLTCVEITQEPRDEYIAYRFIFREADASNVIPK